MAEHRRSGTAALSLPYVSAIHVFGFTNARIKFRQASSRLVVVRLRMAA
ncbi:MAG: hypothetical protein V4602_15805 [Pseudomonadota bacterium]